MSLVYRPILSLYAPLRAGLIVAASMIVVGCSDLIPAAPLIPDLRELYSRQMPPVGKIRAPIISDSVLDQAQSKDQGNRAVPRLSVLPDWAQGVSPPEAPQDYLSRQLEKGSDSFLPTIFPGLMGQFDKITPSDDSELNFDIDTAAPLPLPEPSGTMAGQVRPPNSDLQTGWPSTEDVVTGAPRLPSDQAAAPHLKTQHPDIDINYDALEEAIAAQQSAQQSMSHPSPHRDDPMSSRDVVINMEQLYARNSCPLLGSLSDAYDGFNAETVRFAWEDEPIAAGARVQNDAVPSLAVPLPDTIPQAQSEIRGQSNPAASLPAEEREAAAQNPYTDGMPSDTVPSDAMSADSAMTYQDIPPANLAGRPPRTAQPELSQNVYAIDFDFGSTQVSPKARAILKRVTKNYKMHSGHIRLIGHATAPHQHNSNNLSLMRSLALQASLVAMGIDAEDIELVQSDRRPQSFDSLPNIELEWHPSNISFQRPR